MSEVSFLIPTCAAIDQKTPVDLTCSRQAGRELPLPQTNPDLDIAASLAVSTPAALSSGSRSMLAVRPMFPTLFDTSGCGCPLRLGLANPKCICAFSAGPHPKFSALNVGFYGPSRHNGRDR